MEVKVTIVVIVMKVISIFIIRPMMAVTAELFRLFCHPCVLFGVLMGFRIPVEVLYSPLHLSGSFILYDSITSGNMMVSFHIFHLFSAWGDDQLHYEKKSQRMSMDLAWQSMMA